MTNNTTKSPMGELAESLLTALREAKAGQPNLVHLEDLAEQGGRELARLNTLLDESPDSVSPAMVADALCLSLVLAVVVAEIVERHALRKKVLGTAASN